MRVNLESVIHQSVDLCQLERYLLCVHVCVCVCVCVCVFDNMSVAVFSNLVA